MASSELPATPTDVLLYGLMRRHGDLAITALIDVRRRFDRRALEAALADTLEAFPVLGCRYAPGVRRDRWLPVTTPVGESVHCEEAEADLEAQTERWLRTPIVPERERQVRVVQLPRAGGGARLVLSVMHLAVDGAGVAAVGHVFGARLYGLPPALPLDRRRGLHHALDGLGPSALAAVPLAVLRALRGIAALVLATPRARPFPRDAAGTASWRHVRLPGEAVASARARVSGASVNDVLVAALARVVADRAGAGSALVLYTIDLRRYGRAARLMAANVSGVLIADVPRAVAASLTDAVAFAHGLGRTQQRGLDAPIAMLGPLALARLLPHAAARAAYLAAAPGLLERPSRRAVLITNVGRVDRGVAAFGDELEALRIVGPNVRRLEAPVVVAYGHRGDVHLSIYVPPGLSALAGEELGAELAAALAG